MAKAIFLPAPAPCVPYNRLLRQMIGLCVRIGWPLAPGCYEEHRHYLCGERHGLDEARTTKVVHTPSSQGSGHCCSPRSTNALLPQPYTSCLSTTRTHKQWLSATRHLPFIIKPRASLFHAKGIVTRKRRCHIRCCLKVAEVG